mmetsp:Transcript_3607/g.6262  ORF Transcript_3607/g.6262 Transcript_3607/m.6262 type:complete len:224 (-) Transcript_3607:61-732(-)
MGESFDELYEVVCSSQLGSMLPKLLCKTLLEFRGGCPLHWHLVGDGVEISNNGFTVRQTKASRSAVANAIFKANTGLYWWSIRVDKIEKSGCKYIGVISNDKLLAENLNRNLQSGCKGRRIAWDGSCHSIYYDIDDYNNVHIGKGYQTGDLVTVYLDTDAKNVWFALNGEKVEKIINYKSNHNLQAVVGFGYEENTEQYTILECSWWGTGDLAGTHQTKSDNN